MRFLDHSGLWALGVLVAALGCSGSIVRGTSSGGTTSGSAGAGGTTGSSGTSSGGTGTTTAGSGGAGTTSGSGGSTTSGCVTAADCPAAPGPCVTSECNAATETCTTADVPAGALASAGVQIAGDCKKVICDGAGNASSMPDDTDVPPSSEVCITYTCSSGMAVTHYNAVACQENGGQVCATPGGPDQGLCVACNVDADCASGAICQLNHCVQLTCLPFDCGEPPCPPCPVGDPCQNNSECESGDCGSTKFCVAASCTDGLQNEGETGVDCGGPICRPEGKLCPPGESCLIDADCQSGMCGDGTCG